MKQNLAVHFSSVETAWETPQELFDKLHRKYNFTLDVCALPHNAKLPRYFTPEDDGLSKSWSGEICWMNPPYGREIGQWVRKAVAEKANTITVGLLPSRTDTVWWHACVMAHASQVSFIKGRLRFQGAKHSAPFPSVIVVWGTPQPKPIDTFNLRCDAL